MPKQKKTTIPADTALDTFIDSVINDLEGRFDREAIGLILSAGVFGEDPEPLASAVERLSDPKPAQAVSAWMEEHLKSEGAVDVNQLDDLHIAELSERTDTAFTLGIAIGRRLGSAPLRSRKGGAK
ncbi:MAG: hypothetical protein ABI051_03300 [Vicinamibacterales bacterium]